MNLRIAFIFINDNKLLLILLLLISGFSCHQFCDILIFQELLKCSVRPWKRNILHIEQVMKYAPVLNENQITYRMMLKLVFHFVALYRLVTKYLFREFDRRLDTRKLANSLITGSVTYCFLQFRQTASTLLQALFMPHSESLPQTMPSKLIA